MNATANTLATLASEFSNAFEQDTHNDGKQFYKLKDGSPRWMIDAIHSAHADILPHDWVYEQCSRVADRMAETDPENWDDSVSDWADSLVDVYNADRAAWLASHLSFGGVVDEAVEELGHSDQGIFGDIGTGQHRFNEQIAAALIQAVRDEAEIAEESDED